MGKRKPPKKEDSKPTNKAIRFLLTNLLVLVFLALAAILYSVLSSHHYNAMATISNIRSISTERSVVYYTYKCDVSYAVTVEGEDSMTVDNSFIAHYGVGDIIQVDVVYP